MLALGFVSASTDAALAAPVYSVSGFVTAQATGLGIAETAVVFYKAGTAVEVAHGATAVDGAYSVDVPEGGYDVSFKPPAGSGWESVVISGETVTMDTTLNVGFVPETPLVTFSGVLRGEGGVPVSGGTIALEGPGRSFVSVRTGASGAFSLSVVPGSYSLSIETESGGEGLDFEDADLTLSGNLDEDLTLPVHTLTVRVVGAGGVPLAGIASEASGVHVASGGAVLAPGITATWASFGGEGTTGADGTWSILVPDVTEGSGSLDSLISGPYRETAFSGVTEVTEDKTISVSMNEAPVLSGVLLGEGGVPLPGVAVLLREPKGTKSWSTTTASDGSFSVEAGGESRQQLYEVEVSGERAEGVPASAAPAYFAFRGAQVTLTKEVHEDLTLPVHAVTVRTLGAGGVPVANVGLFPNPEASRTLAAGAGTLAPGLEAREAYVVENARTSTEGIATLSVPDPIGEVRYEAEPPEGTPLQPTYFDLTNTTTDQTRVIQLPETPLVTFSGVLRGEGGVPVSGGTIALEGPGRSFVSVRTGASGAFSLSVVPGSYSLSIETESGGEGLDFEDADLTLSGNLDEDLTLPVHTLTVRVVGAGGVPLAGIASEASGVHVASGGAVLAPGITATWASFGGEGTTGADGTWSILVPDVTEGSGSLDSLISGPYRETAFSGVTEVTEDKTISVSMNEAPVLSGVLLGEGGVPLPGVAVLLREPKGTKSWSTTTASDGSFSVEAGGESRQQLYEVEVSGERAEGVPASAAPAYFAFRGAQVTLTKEVHEDLTLPVHAVTVRTLGAGGVPVANVGLFPNPEASRTLAAGAGTLAPGLEAREAYVVENARTSTEGIATLSVPDPIGEVRYEAEPPEGTPLQPTYFDLTNTTTDQTRVIQLPETPLVTFSGVLRGEGGVPVSGGTIALEGPGRSFVSVRTGASGAFSLSVVPGSYSLSIETESGGEGLDFEDADLTLSGNLDEDLTLPVHTLTVRVVGAGGVPLAGIASEASGVHVASGGAVLAPGITATWASFGGEGTTGADGTWSILVPDVTEGSGSLDSLISGPYRETAFSGVTEVTEDKTISVSMNEAPVLSGVLLGEGGVPLPGVAVLLREPKGTKSWSTTTASDGSFSVEAGGESRQQLYEVEVSGERAEGVPASAAPAYFAFRGAQVTLTKEVHEDLTLPVHAVTVRTLGAGGVPVANVGLFPNPEASRTLAAGAGTLAPGLEAREAYVVENARTSTEGIATLSVPDPIGEVRYEAEPPEGTPLQPTYFDLTNTTTDQTRAIVYSNFASAPSAGTADGTVQITTPVGTALSPLSAKPVEGQELPAGSVAIVGELSYSVTSVPVAGTIEVHLEVPPGSEPTGVYKLINGTLVNVSSIATISGNTITLHLTDGGLGDEDGKANGVIVDPIVPVHQSGGPQPQTVIFEAPVPSHPNVGSVYLPDATASSGLAVSLSIDKATTKGACKLAGKTVSFKKPGTCIIDANQAGNSAYLPAPQLQQAMTITATAAATHTELSLSSATVSYGSEQALKITATVIAAGGGTIPKARATVSAGAATVCKITLLNGTGTCRPKSTALKSGTYSLTAALDQSSHFGGSTSNTEALKVN